MFNLVSTMSESDFKRDTGLSLESFKIVLKKVKDRMLEIYRENPMSKRGRKSSINIENRLLLTLYYIRKYPVFFDLGKLFKISESYAQKIYFKTSDILAHVLHVGNRKELEGDQFSSIIIDASEQQIERPKKNQKYYYSGKKKRHTIKAQLIVCSVTLQILSVLCCKGAKHDIRLLKESNLRIRDDITKYLDLGYIGIHETYANTITPHKKSKKKELTDEQRKFNRNLSRERIYVEHVNCRCKIFRITKDTYRGKHKGYGKNWNIVAGLVNLRYSECA